MQLVYVPCNNNDNDAVKRREMRAQIKHIKLMTGSKDWVMGGDFNEIRQPKDHDGRDTF